MTNDNVRDSVPELLQRIQQSIAEGRAETHKQFAQARAENQKQFAQARAENHKEFVVIRRRLDELDVKMTEAGNVLAVLAEEHDKTHRS